MSRGKKSRKNRQHKRRLFQQIREDLQVSGEIPTTPEGGLRSERVLPAAQGDPAPAQTAALMIAAVRGGWDVSPEVKARLVREMTSIVENSSEQTKTRVAAFNALRLADKDQYERDHPEEAGRARGGVKVDVSVASQVQANVDAALVVREMIERGELGLLEEVPAPHKPGALGGGGHQRQVEGAAPPEGPEQRSGEGVED